ncbi:Anthranilate synthase, aminase component [Minicystis rosea]|nr:Anthranilate synthase, aminase component [Minicystis rosea]
MSQIFTRTLAADHVTPVRAYASLRSHAPKQSSFLFESVHPGERWGRYSIVGYRAMNEVLYPPGNDALASFARELAGRDVPDPVDPSSPFADTENLAARLSRAAFGFVAYDSVHEPYNIDLWPSTDAMVRLMRDATVVVFDNLRQTMTIAATSIAALNRCEWEMNHGPDFTALSAPNPKGSPEFVDVSVDDETFMDRVRRAKEYIRAGDVFQVVLARTFKSPLRNAEPFDVYRALRVLSPSPYLFFLDFTETPMAGGLTIAGASPETLVRLSHNKMTLRPIAGTRKRGASEEEDVKLAEELLADPKERAEHVMLIDLARNDVGRVCEPGTVELSANMVIERYSHVMHIVSEVTGKPRPDVTPGDVLRSAFPAGTLSGAPKVRAMEIIREMEEDSRGVYGGAVGYVMPDGTLDFAIAIRTVIAKDAQFQVTAGAGIVEESVPEMEAQETRNKAQAALAAIRAAQDAVVEREQMAEARRAREERKRLAEQRAADEAAAAQAAETQPESGEPTS